jgi:hypothetical protein
MGAMGSWIMYGFALDNGESYEVPREEDRTGERTTDGSESAPAYIAGLINNADGYVMLQQLNNGSPTNAYVLFAARHITRVSWQLLGGAPSERKWQFC